MRRRALRLASVVLGTLAGCSLGSGKNDTCCVTDYSGWQDTDTDADGDGYLEADDCNDHDASANPGATETCDGVDNDCDGDVDEGVTITVYADTDSDGYGDPAVSQEACRESKGWVDNDDDCDDDDETINPGVTEICGDGVDGDCDGLTDDDDPDCKKS